MAPISFRKATAADLETVAGLARAADPFGWSIGNFMDALKSGHCITLATEADRIIGYSVLSVVIDEGELQEIAIAPQMQGRGYGKALLAETLRIARNRLIRLIHLEVRESNIRAQNLYTQFGFKIDGMRKNYYRAATGREHAVLMSANLD